uniref:Uncharacterized protein n=1 Tax=Brassica oleracea TaxID=3712 RepID=A0A3P6CGG0_BRAOL|nr:unnamed protein product [Brassica oleracea]
MSLPSIRLRSSQRDCLLLVASARKSRRELVCCSCQSTCTFPKCLWILCSYQWLLLLSS